MTRSNTDPFIPGIYRQHILAGVILAGHQPVHIDTNGGGTAPRGPGLRTRAGGIILQVLLRVLSLPSYVFRYRAAFHVYRS